MTQLEKFTSGHFMFDHVSLMQNSQDCPALHLPIFHRASYCTTRLVRFLYRMRYPHSLHLITSPPFRTFSWPQSPHM